MEKIKLVDICNPKQWKTIPTGELLDNGYPVYGANGVIGFYNEYNHENPVVAITCRGATCGSVNITEPKAYVTGNAMCLDDVRNDIDIEYLYYFLKHYDFKGVISGSAQPQITRQGLEKVILSICSPDEQRSIIDKLKKIEVIIKLRELELNNLDELIKARFVEMFGDQESNPKRWDKCTVGDCCTLKSGTSLPADKENEGGPIPYVKVGDMNYPGNERYITTSSRFVSAETAGKGLFEIGSILFPKRGGAIGTNKKRMTILPVCADLNVMGVSSNGKHLPEFLLAYFDMIDLSSLSDGSSVPQINNKNIAPLEICVPPMDMQRDFAVFVAQVDKSKAVIQKSLDETQLLFDSLMQQYFG